MRRMPHDTTLITTIAAAFVLAFSFGFVAVRLGLQPLVGYLLAGVVIGPYTPGFVADIELALQLAEIGVILLMFGVGLHFSVKDLMAVRGIAIPGAIAQIVTATLIGAGLAHLWGWGLWAGLVFGLSLSVASTVVLLQALEDRHALRTSEGRIAVGWLVVEDLAMVLALVLLPVLGGVAEGKAAAVEGAWPALALALGKVALFVALALVVGPRAVPWLLLRVSRTDSRELFTLSVLALALGIAYGSTAMFGVSFALGAFFAGVILSESDLSHKAGEDSLPLKDAFAVLFFVSVGMLVDPAIIVREPLAVLSVVAVIMLGKSLAAFLIVLVFRYRVRVALVVSASLAQIGEFSFILAGLGVTQGVLPNEARDLILAGALFSIALNPLAFATLPAIERALQARPRLLGWLERRPVHADQGFAVSAPRASDHAVVVGHGRVGGALTPLLEQEALPFVVIERDGRLFDQLQERRIPSVLGDATSREVLEAAHIGDAQVLVIALPDGFQARRVLEIARELNPKLDVVVRTHSQSEFDFLRGQGVGLVIMGERELARGMTEYVLRSFGVPPARAHMLAQGETDTELEAKAERL
jgi:CPA2 family monovalent cation:H+ antiporter-2